MSKSGLPTRPVSGNLETRAFWDATARGVLLLSRCDSCTTVIWYSRPHCPECMSTDVSTFEASGRGVVYSRSITRGGAGAWKPVGPYVLAYVELDEGPRILTNIVGCNVDDVAIGMPVRVVFDGPLANDAGDMSSIYRFEPA